MRIIPARAGFTATAPPSPITPSDHPRSRGVYASTMGNGKGRSGSSPLARGLRLRLLPHRRQNRIIPARAGFTLSRGRCHWAAADHPRSRGVYDDDLADMPLSDRIIPARAGFTGFTGSATAYRQDHPRSRGVYRAIKATDPDRHGSSPLARGLHADHEWRRRVRRIIPARAGFT